MNLEAYLFQTPFTLSGKPHGNLAEQHKRKTILYTKEGFPFFGNRIPVVQREEIVLFPIEVAIEDVKTRNALLFSEINPPAGKELSIKTLSQVLNGSVCVQVNGGTLEVCDVFLSKDRSPNYSKHDVEVLKSSLKRFFDLIRAALPICRSLCRTESQLSLQDEFERSFEVLQKQCSSMIL